MSNLDLLGNDFIKKDGTASMADLEKPQYIGLYFSAHWCGPCRAFTPVLSGFYNEVNKNDKCLEIVFCSSDQNEASFKEYFNTMPWLALPFGSDNKEILSDAFGVNGIPCLIILNQLGEIVDGDGRTTVQTKGLAAIAEWDKKAL